MRIFVVVEFKDASSWSYRRFYGFWSRFFGENPKIRNKILENENKTKKKLNLNVSVLILTHVYCGA